MVKPTMTAKSPASAIKKLADSENIPPIVGIGASAGGLEALQQFFSNMPVPNGLAFVIVQHLTPGSNGALPELLARETTMPVIEAADQMKVMPDCVYVIPPNKDLSILHGKLYVIDLIEPQGLRLPIDFFFQILADDQQERAIGVILSGMGSDGTSGLNSIKEKAGLTLAQDPETTKFESMPRSAINAGFVDIVAPASQLPGKIISFMEHGPKWLRSNNKSAPNVKSQAALEKIEILLRTHTGNDFSLYKKNTLYRRIERRMGLHQLDTMGKYARYLRENPQELDLLFKELLIGVTCFFRDSEVWDFLKSTVIPGMIINNPGGKTFRAWIPACSTGEEAYTLAIVFSEVLEELKPVDTYNLQIYATDLDHDAIDKARHGYYLTNIAKNVTAKRLKKFFKAEKNGYLINKEIRSMVIFAPQNIIMDPPFTKLDILSCRNLLIYLSQELQQKLIALFHYALSPEGVLILGHSEGISNFTNLFNILERKARIYRRIDRPILLSEVSFPARNFPVQPNKPEGPRVTKHTVNLQAHADQLLLKHFAPPAVLVNANGDILYISGRTGKYLEPAAGRANLNLHSMARDGLRYALTSAVKTALLQSKPVYLEGLKIEQSEDSEAVNVTVQMVTSPESIKGTVLIVFTDVIVVEKSTAPNGEKGSAQNMLDELEQAREEIQTLHEEMQSSQEEVRASNEELQSSNEELQSTNEELATSREELQSLNQELLTLNAELQSKVESLSWVNNDMNNLLNSTEIGTVFLDNAMNIRRFTPFATRLFKLIPSDVGRPLTDIVSDLDYPELIEDATQVLQSLSAQERAVTTVDGRWFKASIIPYRTQEDLINGVVINFVDISEAKKLEAKLRKVNQDKDSSQ